MGNYAGWSSQAGFVQPVAASLSTIWELPWIDQPTLALADGNNTIDGVVWTGANTAATSTFAVTNATGLDIVATGGVSRTWTTAAATAPALRVNLTSLATIDWTKDLWIWNRFSAYSLPNTLNYVAAGLYAAASSPFTATMLANGWSNVAGPTTQPTYQKATGINTNAAYTAVPPTGQIGDVSVVRYAANGMLTCYIGTWTDGDWPDTSALSVISKDVQPEGSVIVQLAMLASRANTQLILSAMTRTATAGNVSMTVTHSRLQQ